MNSKHETLHITIDGKTCSCEAGEMLLQIAKRNGIFIPTLCSHEGLEGIGSCRVCIVEIQERGKSRVVASCLYPVEREIEVFTQSDKIKEQRGIILTLLNRLAPNSQKIQQLAAYLGINLPRLKPKEDGDKCILCGRCTLACEALGAGAIAKANRGVTKEIATPYNQPTNECIGCGACATVCPTEAIAYEQDTTSVTIWNRSFELIHCAHCGATFGTQAQYDFLRAQEAKSAYADKPGLAAQVAAPELQELALCDSCSKRELAKKVALAEKSLD